MKVLTASWVVPVVRPPIKNGTVAVVDGRVVWVGGPLDPRARGGETLSLGEGVLLPGLVNAHCHLELSWLGGKIPGDGGFVPWVSALVEARAEESPAVALPAAREAIRSLEDSGTAAVGDVSNTLMAVEALGASRLRAVVFYELLGWNPDAASEVILRADQRLAKVSWQPSRNVEVRLALHAPHSVSPELFRALRERGGAAALHLAESPAESRFLMSGDGSWAAFLRKRVGEIPFSPPGLSPVRYVSGLGALHPGMVVAHCVQVDREDRAILRRAGVFVALCPRSNRSLGVGVAPARELLEDGVCLCLGTDSLASSPSLDLLEEASALREDAPDLSPEAIVRIATLGGAQALGLKDMGSIEPGKKAAFAFAPAPRNLQSPEAFLVSGEARARSVIP